MPDNFSMKRVYYASKKRSLDFRLTSVAQKRLCLSSLILRACVGGHFASQVFFFFFFWGGGGETGTVFESTAGFFVKYSQIYKSHLVQANFIFD